MSARILRLIVISVAAMMVGACGGSASASSPASPSAPIGGPVRTESDAVARVIASEPRFSGITARDPGLIGQAAWYEVTPASGVGAFLVTMRIGWGDCPAGCIDKHQWTYTVDEAGTVTKTGETGPAVPSGEPGGA